MAMQEEKQDMPHKYREDNEPHKQTGNIDARNNNADMDMPVSDEPNVERANDAGIGDSGLNDVKLSNYTQNHSSDA
jgi:hypothetical protein